MRVRLFFYFCAIVILATFCSLTHAQELNTHQTIHTSPPKMFKLSVAQGDQIDVNVFNTNANIDISFQIDGISYSFGQNQICFAYEMCTYSFDSEWKGDGVLSVVIFAYQYSYEIFHNGDLIKQETDMISNFLAGNFIYFKSIPPGTYTFRVSYQSDFVPFINMTFLEQNITLEANQVNEINFQFEEQLLYYQFFFTQTFTEDQTLGEIIDHFFSVTIELPNQFLKGCDGTNIYDPKIRACPISDYKTQDTIKISKIGTFPTFELQKEQKVQIKITIIEAKKWSEFFQNQTLTVFIGNGTDPSAFYGLTTHEMDSKFKMKKQCSMTKTSCTFVFNLSKGNYFMMPSFLQTQQNAFVYLYERFNGDYLIEHFYSVLPTISQDKKFYQSHIMLEFINHKEKLTEFEITCENQFILYQSGIVQKVSTPLFQDAMPIRLIDYSADKTMNHDLNKAQIFTSLEPNKTYVLLFTLFSPLKFGKYVEENKNAQEIEDPTMDIEKEELPQLESFYLETPSIQIKIKNGKFPHKKLKQIQEQSINNNEPQESVTEKTEQIEEIEEIKQIEYTGEESKQTQDDDTSTKPVDAEKKSDDQSHLTTEEQKQPKPSSKSTSILIQVLGALVVILILLLTFYLCVFNRAPASGNDHKQLVTEQASGTITLPDSSMEISHVIKSEQSMSRNQTTEIDETPKPRQKLYELKEIEQESLE